MKYPMKKVDNKEPIAAAVLVTPNIIEAYFGLKSWWPQNKPVLTQAPIPKQKARADITITIVVFVTAAAGVLETMKPTVDNATAPQPKQSVCDNLRTSVLEKPFLFSKESVIGATKVVTATVERYGKILRKDDFARETFSAEERKLGNQANKP